MVVLTTLIEEEVNSELAGVMVHHPYSSGSRPDNRLCYSCNRPGHIASVCPRTNDEEASLAVDMSHESEIALIAVNDELSLLEDRLHDMNGSSITSSSTFEIILFDDENKPEENEIASTSDEIDPESIIFVDKSDSKAEIILPTETVLVSEKVASLSAEIALLSDEADLISEKLASMYEKFALISGEVNPSNDSIADEKSEETALNAEKLDPICEEFALISREVAPSNDPISEEKSHEWCIDSGASSHMTNDETLLNEIKYYDEPTPVTLGDKSIVMAHAEGKLRLKALHPDRTYISLERVLYVPKLMKNLLSVRTMTKQEAEVRFVFLLFCFVVWL